jgi:hypothetical protein
VDELEDVFYVEGDVVDEEDGRFGGRNFRVRKRAGGRLGCGEWRALQRIDAVARFGVDVAGGEMIGYVQGGEAPRGGALGRHLVRREFGRVGESTGCSHE